MEPKQDSVIVELRHPHVFAVDIKGNFHRGLMIGILIGYVLGIVTIFVSKFVWR